MIEQDKNMDQVFRDKLADFEKAPPAFVWENLQSELAGQKHRKLVVFYWRVAGVAAVLLLAFVAGWQISTNRNTNPEVFVENTEQIVVPKPIISEQETKAENTQQTNRISEKNEILEQTTMFANASSLNPKQENKQLIFHPKIENPGFIKSLQAILATNNSDGNTLKERNPLMQKVLFSAEELRIIEQNKALLAMNSNDRDQNKWMVGASVSPVYSVNQTSQTADYSSNMANPDANDNLNVGGGLSFEYKTQKRWSFQSGVYYNKLEQSSSNTVPARYSVASKIDGLNGFFSTPVSTDNGEMLMNSVAGVIQIEKLPSSVQLEGSLDRESINSTVLVSDANFDQNFEYLEIPLFAKYQLIDSKIGVQILSGVSTNILVGNNVFLQNDMGRDKVGKTNGMVDLSYSGVLGVGLNYALTSNLFLNVEPRFKYFFNSLNEDSNISYKPYSFGVYTGISYSF